MAKILVIDDEQSIRDTLSAFLVAAGYEVETAASSEELNSLLEEPLDLLITDIVMPGHDGLEAIRFVRESRPEVKIIAISGGGRIAPDVYLNWAKNLGADRTFMKPIPRGDLISAARDLLSSS